jgi:hypothetical protein
MHLRELPENEVRMAGVFVEKSKVGEMVQSFLDDPDVLGIAQIEPGLTINDNWFVVVKYGVLDLETRQTEITHRLEALTGNSFSFRTVAE